MATRTTRAAGKTEGTAKNGRQDEAQPLLNQRGREIQKYGTMRDLPIALEQKARRESCDVLNQILADSTILFNLYKKHHWLVSGHTFYQLHLLFDKHADEQLELIDLLAERVQTLGGIAVSDPRHVAEITKVERPPNGREEVPVMISRLLEAHEVVIKAVREGIEATEENKDWGTNDLLMGDVLRTNELQVWFVAEHLVDTPPVRS
ncbi:MAG TPA: DNA starvation/stationary phase protection protein [Chloroflexia bacterium]|nr:DNA starvation/stationary phase protection protein [Chloroflexia bacterium]